MQMYAVLHELAGVCAADEIQNGIANNYDSETSLTRTASVDHSEEK